VPSPALATVTPRQPVVPAQTQPVDAVAATPEDVTPDDVAADATPVEAVAAVVDDVTPDSTPSDTTAPDTTADDRTVDTAASDDAEESDDTYQPKAAEPATAADTTPVPVQALARRTPRAQVAPTPTPVVPAAPSRPRTASDVRGMLSGFRAGVERGRTTPAATGQGSDEPDPTS
jgi:hypothetical protein